MNFGMQLRLRQHLTITPQIQQALRLLQLSSQECAQEIEQALMSNPFLEEDSETRSPALEAAQQPAAEPEVPSTASPESFEPLEKLDDKTFTVED